MDTKKDDSAIDKAVKKRRLKSLFTPAVIVLILIIIIQSVYYIYLLSEKKTSHHEDEYFSYSLSNNPDKPLLYGDEHLKFTDGKSFHRSGEDFKKSLMTNNDTRFDYAMVWHNQAIDTHPPLYYAILHTLCSFTPGKFSWWYGYIINLVAFAVTQVFLYRLTRLVCRTKIFPLICCAYYGFTLACIAGVIFVRMYCLMNMFTVMYAYYSFRLMQQKGAAKCSVKNVVPVMLCAFFGALTQHFFLLIIFFITLGECIWMMCKKRWRTLFFFGGAAAAGVLLSIAVFPAVISHLFNNSLSDSENLEMFIQSHLYWRLMIREVFGLWTAMVRSDSYAYILGAVITLAILSIPVIFLLRKSKFIANCKKAIKTFIKKVFVNNTKPVILYVSSLLFLFVISANLNYIDTGDDSCRYIYCTIPFVCIIVARLLEIITRIFRKKQITACLTVASMALACTMIWLQHSRFTPPYMLTADTDNGRINEYIDNDDCIMLLQDPIYTPAFCEMLQNADDVFITCVNKLEYKTPDSIDECRKIAQNSDCVYLLIQSSCLTPPPEETGIDSNENNDSSEQGNVKVGMSEEFKKLARERAVYLDDTLDMYAKEMGMKYEYVTKESTHSVPILLYKFTK